MAARDDLTDETGILERWLRSWPHRVALVALLVLAVSVLESLRWYSAFAPESRVRVGVELLRWNALRNALWGGVALTLVPLSLRCVPRGALAAPVFVLVQVALSAGVGLAITDGQDRLVQGLGLDSPWDLLRQELRRNWLQQMEERGERDPRFGPPPEERPDPDGGDANGGEPDVGGAGPADPGAADPGAEGRPDDGAAAGADPTPDAGTQARGERPPPPGGEDGPWRDRGGRSDRGERNDRGRGRPRPGGFTPGLGQNLGSGMLTYWAVLAAVALASAHLRTQASRREAVRAERLRLELERELSVTRLTSLEAQLRPHFLFNALHSVSGLVRLGRTKEADRALSTLGQLLRDTLDRSGEHARPLSEEWALSRRYLELEAVRFGDRLVVREDLPAELADATVPALVLLPLVENAVRHGVGARSEPVTVELRAGREPDGSLWIEVRDDGPPFPAEVLDGTHRPRTGGIGLSNTRDRLRTLYGASGRLELENPPGGGALVRLRFPPGRPAVDADRPPPPRP